MSGRKKTSTQTFAKEAKKKQSKEKEYFNFSLSLSIFIHSSSSHLFIEYKNIFIEKFKWLMKKWWENSYENDGAFNGF